MKQLLPLEESIAKIHKDLPHLPKAITTWLVENAWWLVIIGLVIGAVGALTAITAMTAGSLVVGAMLGASVGGAVWASSAVNLIVLVLLVAIEAMAIQPLKAKQKRGWDLLFVASLVSVAGSLVGALLSGPLGVVVGIVWALVGAAVAWYVLFELRAHYMTPRQPVEASVSTKSK